MRKGKTAPPVANGKTSARRDATEAGAVPKDRVRSKRSIKHTSAPATLPPEKTARARGPSASSQKQPTGRAPTRSKALPETENATLLGLGPLGDSRETEAVTDLEGPEAFSGPPTRPSKSSSAADRKPPAEPKSGSARREPQSKKPAPSVRAATPTARAIAPHTVAEVDGVPKTGQPVAASAPKPGPRPTNVPPPARLTQIPPPLAAPSVRRSLASRMPVIEERLEIQTRTRYALPDDGMPRSRRPGSLSVRPGALSAGVSIPPIPRAPRVAFEDPLTGTSDLELAVLDWPPAELSAEPAARASFDDGTDWSFKADESASLLSPEGPPSEAAPSVTLATSGEVPSDPRSPAVSTPRVGARASDASVASALATTDGDTFNPFVERSQRGSGEAQRGSGEAQRRSDFGSFDGMPEESVPSGLAAMFGSLRTTESSRERSANDSGKNFPGSGMDHGDSDPPASPKSQPPTSSLREGPSDEAFHSPIGELLNTKFALGHEDDPANLTAHLEALLKDAARTPTPSRASDFPEFDEPEKKTGRENRDKTQQTAPAPTDTLRGTQADDDFFGEESSPPSKSVDDSTAPNSDATPPRHASPPSAPAPSAPANNDILDLDSRDVTSLPPTPGDRWPDDGSDDFDVEPARRFSTAAPHSSEPPPSEPRPDGYEPADERASEWGTSQASSLARSIPNYGATLELVGQLPGVMSVESRRPMPLSSRPPKQPKQPSHPVPRSAGRGVWIAMTLVVGAVSLTVLPWYMLTRADKHAQNCFHDIRKTAEGNPEDCVPSTAELALPRILPWLKEDALRIKETIDFQAARLAYDKATAIVPNAARRDDAVQRWLQLTYRGSEVERARSLGVVAGAHAAVTQFALANREPEAVSFALRSARAIGDLDAMRALATGSTGVDPFAMSLRRGALFCLLGDPDEGARAFVASELAQQRFDANMAPQGLARLGLVACGKPNGSDGEVDAHKVTERFQPALLALEASFETASGLQQVRTFLEDGKLKVGGIQRLRLIPSVLRGTTPTALDALRLLAPQHAPGAVMDLHALRTPWMLLDVEAPVQAVYIDTRAAELAAPLLASLAAKVTGKALDCSGEECPNASALKSPDSLLNEAASMVWLEAAAEHARLGHREAAIDAANHATELTPSSRRYRSAPVHLAVGDADGALALLAKAVDAIDSYTPFAQTRIHLNHALALAHLGRYEEALPAAEMAYKAASRAADAARQDRRSTDAEIAVEDDKVAAAWLWGAMALVLGKADNVAEALREATTKELVEVATWLGFATRPEGERRAERWELSLAVPSQPALPAVMYVVSRAVPSMSDVEVWLDRVFQEESRTQPVRSMLARAEAARWRNAPEAERNWQSSSAKMLGLIKDYKTSLLAHIMELR